VEHRRGTGRRRSGGHRARPRYGRIAVLAGSLVLTLAAAGAAAGFVPYAGSDRSANAAEDDGSKDAAAEDDDADPSDSPVLASPGPDVQPRVNRRTEPRAGFAHGDPNHAPDDSGQGRRIVYDMSDQRVWLLAENDDVRRSYLVSGSVLGNLEPGSYDVYSRSRHAVSFDQASTMEYMVRFTEGDTAAIGFHDIPEDLDGQPLQTVEQLGTPRSHGCIRQRPADARAMWRFGVIDTPVVVLA
jgi:hypothetical protein